MNSGDHHIVLAGATGRLGTLLAQSLVARGAEVTALVRHGARREATEALRTQGVDLVEVDYADRGSLVEACWDATCVVSALSGLREVVVDAQSALLDAAVEAGCPRFIPSDFAMDFTKLEPGTNRNLDLRRAFQQRLDLAPIAATSILNGAFADMLAGQMPIVLFPIRRVLYWGDPDQRMDFTTMADTAEYTAAAALDPKTPRFLRIAGDSSSARELARTASAATGRHFELVRAGGLSRLESLIKITRALSPSTNDPYPVWQGMQYLHGMFSGRGKLEPLDNDRYDLDWTRVREILAKKNDERKVAPPLGGALDHAP